MRTALLQQTSQYKEGEMESIDVHDLPEDDAQLIAAFVEFLRLRHIQRGGEPATEIPVEAKQDEPVFASWPLGVKGTLSREEIYDYL
jgi:hypothetical protein